MSHNGKLGRALFNEDISGWRFPNIQYFNWAFAKCNALDQDLHLLYMSIPAVNYNFYCGGGANRRTSDGPGDYCADGHTMFHDTPMASKLTEPGVWYVEVVVDNSGGNAGASGDLFVAPMIY